MVGVKYFFNLIPLRKHNVKPDCSELQLSKMAATLLPKRGSHNYQARQMISIHYSRWIDSVWKSRPYADAFKENPINLYIF